MINRSYLISIVKDEKKMLTILKGTVKIKGLPRLRAQYQSWIYNQGATAFDVSIALAAYAGINIVTEDTRLLVKVTYLKPDGTKAISEPLEVSHPQEAEHYISMVKGVEVISS